MEVGVEMTNVREMVPNAVEVAAPEVPSLPVFLGDALGVQHSVRRTCGRLNGENRRLSGRNRGRLFARQLQLDTRRPPFSCLADFRTSQ